MSANTKNGLAVAQMSSPQGGSPGREAKGKGPGMTDTGLRHSLPDGRVVECQ